MGRRMRLCCWVKRVTLIGCVMMVGRTLCAPYSIVLSNDAKPWERAAAADLDKYLKLRLGENVLTVGDACSVVFYVGDTSKAGENGMLSTQMKEDSWCVRSFGGDVIVNGGGTRGVRYAVSHFLEDCCGVRWWSETEEDVPRASALKLPKLTMSGVPAFLYRDIWRSPDRAYASSELAIRRRLNRNGDVPFTAVCGGSFDYGPPAHAHTFNRYVPWEKYGKDHPEWFSLVDGKRCGGDDFTTGGQLCLTHPGLKEMFVSQLLAHIARGDAAADAAGIPHPRLYDVSMNDNKRCCQCESCRNAAEKYGMSGVYLRFVNDLAAEVAKTHADVFLTMLAYYYTEEPPKGGVRAADNVVVKLCNTRANMTVSLLHEDNRLFRDLVDAWAACAKHLFVWDYDITYTDDSMGYPFPSELHYADKFRYFAEHHVTGLFWEQEFAYRTDLPDLKYYLKSQLAEDPCRDYDKLLKRTFDEYFGPKAGPHVLAARRRLAEASRKNNGSLEWFPTLNHFNHLRDEDLEFLQCEYDAAIAAAGENDAVKRRLWLSRQGIDRLRVRRARMMRREKGKWVLDPSGYGLYGKASTLLVDDPDAQSEKAVRIALDDGKYKLPLVVAYYDAVSKKTLLRHLQKTPPVSSGYEWVRAGSFRAANNGYVYLTDQWTVQAHLPSADLVDREFELWVSMRFEKDAVFIGRIELRDVVRKRLDERETP